MFLILCFWITLIRVIWLRLNDTFYLLRFVSIFFFFFSLYLCYWFINAVSKSKTFLKWFFFSFHRQPISRARFHAAWIFISPRDANTRRRDNMYLRPAERGLFTMEKWIWRNVFEAQNIDFVVIKRTRVPKLSRRLNFRSRSFCRF